MTTLLLAPHNDDEALFASYICLAYRPFVMVTFTSGVQAVQGVDADTRIAESLVALTELGIEDWGQLSIPDNAGERVLEASLRVALSVTRDQGGAMGEPPSHVFAPAVEEGGHDQHSLVGRLADEVFGADMVSHYLTYRRGHGRSTSSSPIERRPEWIPRKLRALACYESQILLDSTRPWFDSYLALSEYWQDGTSPPPELPSPTETERRLTGVERAGRDQLVRYGL